tara:strand:- start:670 stop:1656 length:987 start_codon:yes stop_codon:yes gene_type:complete
MNGISTKGILTITSLTVFVFYIVGVMWSFEPDQMDIRADSIQDLKLEASSSVVGYTTTTALIKVAETLLNKPGGYLSNDILPPSVMLDNIPAWEFGVLEMVRDMSLIMRKEFSRSQSQSSENEYLKEAHPLFNIDHASWAMPSAEGEYGKAIVWLYKYRSALIDKSNGSNFYSRTDNLREWLSEAEKRLGSYSQRLSTSVGRAQLGHGLAGDADAKQANNRNPIIEMKTSWWKIDDEFYEARGACWALLHFLKAIEIDFNDVLVRKNAKVSVQQIIRELESSQETVWSPMILNGNGFGFVANHSLVMANYISRANAALIELNELLSKG